MRKALGKRVPTVERVRSAGLATQLLVALRGVMAQRSVRWAQFDMPVLWLHEKPQLGSNSESG